MIRSTIFNLLFFPLSITTAATVLLASYVAGPKGMRATLKNYSWAVIWLTRRVLKARVEIRGLERFKDGTRPALIVSKHQSELDVFPPIALFPDLAAIAMAELARYPLIGPVVRKLDYILVTVDGPRKNQLDPVIEGAKRAHAQGRPLLIYPEGELMRIGSRERYRAGVWHIYDALGCEATPVALCCGLVWPQRKWRKEIGQTAIIEFLEPIPPGMTRGAFLRELEYRIETRTMELVEEFGSPEVVAVAKERHRLNLTNVDDRRARELRRPHAA